MEKSEAIAISPSPGWRDEAAPVRTRRRHTFLLGGSLVMLVGSTLVSGVNFAFSIVMARWLGPEGFSHVNAAVTLLMLASAITLSFQMVCAKFVARNETAGAKTAVYRTLHRRAWWVGSLLGGTLLAASGPLTSYLRLPSSWIVILLALGIAFYVPLGVRRGGLQGTCAFPRLSGNFLLEVLVKLAVAVVLVQIGWGVLGAVGAISLSVLLAYTTPGLGPRLSADTEVCEPASFREGMQAIVFFVGQVIINNIDIILVKHFFAPREAGLYAVVALVGRGLYFVSWSVVSAMFPVSAASSKQEKDDRSVLAVPIALVVSLSVGFILLFTLFPHALVRGIFGAGFQEAAPLFSLYAAATGAYAIGVTFMAYEMSRRIANTGWLQLLFSGLVVAGIHFFHSSLWEVVMVRLVLMVALLALVALPFLRARSAPLPEAA